MLAQLSGEEKLFFSVPVKSRIVPACFSTFKLKMDEMNILVRDKQYIQQSLYEISHLRFVHQKNIVLNIDNRAPSATRWCYQFQV